MAICVKFLLGEPVPLDYRKAVIWLAQGEIVLTKDQHRSVEAFLASSGTTYGFLMQHRFVADLETFMNPAPEPALVGVGAPPAPEFAPPPPMASPPGAPARTEPAPYAPSTSSEERARAFRARNVMRNIKQFDKVTPMGGTLSITNTAGGSMDSLARYFDLKGESGNFPYRWVISGGDYDDLVEGRPVVARVCVARLTNARGKTFTQSDQSPIGKIPFVMLKKGEVFVGPNLRMAADKGGGKYTVNHLHIAELARHVLFAGQITFTTGSIMEQWSADSGGYACNNAQAKLCGLPMGLYEDLYGV